MTMRKLFYLGCLAIAALVLTTAPASAQACAEDCTRKYISCNTGVTGTGTRMPLPGQSCGDRLRACDRACNARLSQELLGYRLKSYKYATDHCTKTLIICNTGGSPLCGQKARACSASVGPRPTP